MTGSKHWHHVCTWTSCQSDHQRRGHPSPWACRHRHHHQSTQYLLIWDFIFVCFLFPIHFLPHALSAHSSELRFSLWTGELKAPVSSGQQSPCSGFPISQHRTRALNKLVIIRSTAAAAVIVKMEFQPTWLSWGGKIGRQQCYGTQSRLAAIFKVSILESGLSNSKSVSS